MITMSPKESEELLETLSIEVRELSLGSNGELPRISGPPDPLRFLREFVVPNRPCIITNAIDHWPALRSWDNFYLCNKLAQSLVSCHFTPDGRADAIVDDGVFASALVETLPFPEALQHVLSSNSGQCVAYLQQQNNCFPLEFAALADDADGDITWASEAFGCKPEVVNLWIGTPESVTSFHKDHYENLYAVVSGEKHFTLLPPTDVHRMYVKKYPVAQYERTLFSGCRRQGA